VGSHSAAHAIIFLLIGSHMFYYLVKQTTDELRYLDGNFMSFFS
jgi:hypothetical protein